MALSTPSQTLPRTTSAPDAAEGGGRRGVGRGLPPNGYGLWGGVLSPLYRGRDCPSLKRNRINFQMFQSIPPQPHNTTSIF